MSLTAPPHPRGVSPSAPKQLSSRNLGDPAPALHLARLRPPSQSSVGTSDIDMPPASEAALHGAAILGALWGPGAQRTVTAARGHPRPQAPLHPPRVLRALGALARPAAGSQPWHE